MLDVGLIRRTYIVDKLKRMNHLRRVLGQNVLGDLCLQCLALVESLSLTNYDPISLAKFINAQCNLKEEEVLLLKLSEHILVYRDRQLSVAMGIFIDGQDVFCFAPECPAQLLEGDYIRPRDEVQCIVVRKLS